MKLNWKKSDRKQTGFISYLLPQWCWWWCWRCCGEMFGYYLPWHFLFRHREACEFAVGIVKLTGVHVALVLFLWCIHISGLFCCGQCCREKGIKVSTNKRRFVVKYVRNNEKLRSWLLTWWLCIFCCKTLTFQTFHNPLQGFGGLHYLMRHNRNGSNTCYDCLCNLKDDNSREYSTNTH